MADGKGCTCHAKWQGECACGADWTPQEILNLQAKVEQLQREKDSLHLELDATEHQRISNNEYLITRAEAAEAERDRLRGEVAELRGPCTDDWIDQVLAATARAEAAEAKQDRLAVAVEKMADRAEELRAKNENICSPRATAISIVHRNYRDKLRAILDGTDGGDE